MGLSQMSLESLLVWYVHKEIEPGVIGSPCWHGTSIMGLSHMSLESLLAWYVHNGIEPDVIGVLVGMVRP